MSSGVSLRTSQDRIVDQGALTPAAAAAAAPMINFPQASSSPSSPRLESGRVSPQQGKKHTHQAGSVTAVILKPREETALKKVADIVARSEKTYNSYGASSKEILSQYSDDLQEAFSILHEVGFPEAGRTDLSKICFLYGRRRYAKSMEDSLALNLAAVSNLLGKEGLKPQQNSLKAFVKEIRANNALQETQKLICSKEFLQSEVFKNCQEKELLGFAVARAGYSMQNIKVYDHKDHLDSFNNIYGNAYDIFEMIGSLDCKWEQVEILYGTTRFRSELEFPGDIQKKLDSLLPVEELLNSFDSCVKKWEKLAQIQNIRYFEAQMAFKPKDVATTKAFFENQFVLISRARSIAENIEENNFLKTMFLCSKASCALKAHIAHIPLVENGNPVDKEMITRWMGEVIDDMQGRKIDLYGQFLLLNAKIMYTFGNFRDAMDFLDQASDMNFKTNEPNDAVEAYKQHIMDDLKEKAFAKMKELGLM